MLKRLNPLVFAGSFALGMLLVYALEPPPTVVIRFPSPQNAGKIVYRNSRAPGCYKYRAKRVPCEMYKGRVKEQPVELA